MTAPSSPRSATSPAGLCLQKHGVALGLEAQLDALHRLIAFARERSHAVRWQQWNSGPNARRSLFCVNKCKDSRGQKQARWILRAQLDGLCIGCYMRRHSEAPGTRLSLEVVVLAARTYTHRKTVHTLFF
jgi:hypothetical protein